MVGYASSSCSLGTSDEADHELIRTKDRSCHSGQVKRDPESRKPWIPAFAGMTSKGSEPKVDFESTHYFKPLAFKARVV